MLLRTFALIMARAATESTELGISPDVNGTSNGTPNGTFIHNANGTSNGTFILAWHITDPHVDPFYTQGVPTKGCTCRSHALCPARPSSTSCKG